MIGAVNNFGWKYFKTLNRRENIFYSPYSIVAALSIAANGAIKATRAEILSALGVANVGILNSGFKNFRDYIGKVYSGANLLFDSNLMLVNKDFTGNGLNPTFENIVANAYGSEIRAADFAGDLSGEKAKISAWVGEKTNGFISDFQAEPSSDTIIELLNVIYFKGAWAYPFYANSTEEQIFTNRDGSKSSVQMMRDSFAPYIYYHSDENFKAIRLPYKGSTAAMYLILPKNEWSLNVAEEWNATDFSYRENFIRQLDIPTKIKGTDKFFEGEIRVRLPRFELDIDNNLVENLQAIGINRAFTDAAEFYHIVEDTPLKINDATHRAKVKVAEKGTEAAAASLLDGIMLGAPFPEAVQFIEFHADRPFVFVIRDVKSGVNLFAGVVNSLK